MDVPKPSEEESENKMLVLEEMKDKSINNKDGKPTHFFLIILIYTDKNPLLN